MKVTADRNRLSESFARAATFSPGKSPKPILEHVLLEATNGATVFHATDLECSARLAAEGVEFDKPGAVLLDTVQFPAILRECTDDVVTIEDRGTTIFVRCGRSEYKLPSANPGDFPIDRSEVPPLGVSLSGAAFRDLIEAVEFATDVESTRYALAGIKLEFRDGMLTAVGTDGRRLATAETTAEGKLDGCLYHVKPARKINRVIPGDKTIRFTADANKAVLIWDGGQVITRQVEGRYPKWRDVIPEKNQDGTARGWSMTTVVGPFHAAVRQASIACSVDSRGVDFRFDAGAVTFSAATHDHGQSEVRMVADYDGKEVILRLDHSFVRAFLKTLPPEANLDISIDNADSCALFRCGNTRYVIMPLSRDAAQEAK